MNLNFTLVMCNLHHDLYIQFLVSAFNLACATAITRKRQDHEKTNYNVHVSSENAIPVKYH